MFAIIDAMNRKCEILPCAAPCRLALADCRGCPHAWIARVCSPACLDGPERLELPNRLL